MSYPSCLRVPATDGTTVEIPDPKRFCDHLEAFHRSGISTHVERGYAFRVDDGFRSLVQDQVPQVALFR